MKANFLICLCFLILNSCSSFNHENRFKFNKEGEFKIVQFTDLHIQKAVSDSVFDLTKKIIDFENPDLVVITGDLIFEDSINDLLSKLATIFAEKKVHWVIVYGNHDDEFGLSRKKLTQILRSFPYNLNSSTSGINGESNFIIPISGRKNKHEALLYFFDSNGKIQLKDSIMGKYDWIDFSQIEWYRSQSVIYTKKNKGNPIPSLAFFHIPLPEYKEFFGKDSVYCIGSRKEFPCSPSVNSGLFTSMLERNDIMGVFVGHDHVNDYIGYLKGIALAYGRFSGSKNVYGVSAGARVIVLKEGKHEFETWIRLKGGEILNYCQYPNTFNICLKKAH